MTRRFLGTAAGALVVAAVVLFGPGGEADAHSCAKLEVLYPTSTTVGDAECDVLHGPHLCARLGLEVVVPSVCVDPFPVRR